MPVVIVSNRPLESCEALAAAVAASDDLRAWQCRRGNEVRLLSLLDPGQGLDPLDWPIEELQARSR